jgi:dihydroorotate dehydrogenase (fumarate)
MRVRWLGILSGRSEISLACSGGVHSGADAVRAILAGACGVQLVSCLLARGPEYLRVVLAELKEWMAEHEYNSVRQMRGALNLSRCPDPTAFERANYMRTLNSWREKAGAASAGGDLA